VAHNLARFEDLAAVQMEVKVFLGCYIVWTGSLLQTFSKEHTASILRFKKKIRKLSL
jgi:hypothetical protein